MSPSITIGLPTPPVEDHKPVHTIKKSTKATKPSSRGSKRANAATAHDHGPIVLDGRHKRVWKACERCRMKKTKCDGESPCKRCKDDGLVCTAGSRKKTEYKQLPRGYAEVLENTQYALIATVQKLYSMVRNGESWTLGEPELNDRGLPIIHNIAEKLGCIRPCPDLPCAFPEDAEDFTALQQRMTEAHGDEAEDSSDHKHAEDLLSATHRAERASSYDTVSSTLSKDNGALAWDPQSQSGTVLNQQFQMPEPQFGDEPLYSMDFKSEPQSSMANGNNYTTQSTASPVYSDFQADSSDFRNDSPFSPWSNAGSQDFLGPAHMLDLTALYMRQQQLPLQQTQQQKRYSYPPVQDFSRSSPTLMDSEMQRVASLDCLNPASLAMGDGTVRPNMLDCNSNFDIADQMDNIVMFGDCPQ